MAVSPNFPRMIRISKDATQEDRIKAMQNYERELITLNPQVFKNGKMKNPLRMIKDLIKSR